MTKERYYPALDGVRGLAVLLVVAYHYGGGANSSLPLMRSLARVFATGNTGVTLFFILSGFLITGILWDARGASHWWRNFYMRRIVRIAPLYYFTLLLALVTGLIAAKNLHGLAHLWVYAVYLQNVPALIKQSEDTGSPLWLSHLWSLAVEEQFYLFWPFLIVRARSMQQVKIAGLLLFLASFTARIYFWHFSANPVAMNHTLVARGGELAVGAFLAMSFRDGTWYKVARFAHPVSIAFLLLFVACCLPLSERLVTTWGTAAVTIFWAAYLVLALGSGSIAHAMSAGWLRLVGTLSYGLYVYHELLLGVFDRLVKHFAPHASAPVQALLRAAVMLIVVPPITWISYRYFEQPIRSFGRRFQPRPTPHPVA